MGALKATQRRAHACVWGGLTYKHPASMIFVSVHTRVFVCRMLHLRVCARLLLPPNNLQTCMAFNFEWRQMLCRPILRQWKEPFLSTYRSMGSHSIRKSETISTRLMTPFWGAGELWPRGRRVASGGARKSIQAGWGISLTAFIMSALHFFSVLSGNTLQIAYCSRVLNALSLWSRFSKAPHNTL